MEGMTKVLGFSSHLLSFLLVSCFCYLFYYFTDYTLFTLLPAHLRYTQSKLFVGVMSVVILYLGFNILFNYFMTMLTDPGTSMDNPDPCLLAAPNSCRSCGFPKPLRTHHCSICHKCVFQMDHHCPWMWNCIGHENRRYFISFLTCLAAELLIIWGLNWGIKDDERQKNQFIYMFDVVLGVVFGVIFLFAAFHWYMVLRGKTSLEVCSTEDYLKDMTVGQRIDTVFGSHNALWTLVPNLKDLSHDGISWGSENEWGH